MHELQDEAIIQLVLQGNNTAYAILVERYQHFVFTFALKLLKNNEDAEEATQDAFVKAHKYLKSYSGESKFSTWLYTITKNTCLSRLRGNKIELRSEKEITTGNDNSTTEVLEQRSKKELLSKAIGLLAEEDAAIITLFYIQEQTLEEIGTIMSLKTGNVKVKLYRARKKLKDILDTQFSKEVSGLR